MSDSVPADERDETEATEVAEEQAAEVDALVAALVPGVGIDPGVRARDVVLVVGPWLAGVTSLVAALRKRLLDRVFVEVDDLDDNDAPTAVVFVASAVAPLTRSDCVLLDAAAAHTDVVIGAVSKIDVHQTWRDMLAADRDALSAFAPRYADMTWTGVAAGPERGGSPQIDELVTLLDRELVRDDLARRNRLRAWETRLRQQIQRHEDAAAGISREARIAALRLQRGETLRRRRLVKSERTIGLRSRFAQAKVQLTYFARNRCISVRGELAADAAAMTRGRLPAFEEYVLSRVDDALGEVSAGVTEQLGDLAAEFALTPPGDEPPPARPPLPRPQLTRRGVEERLMILLGAGFGLGIALTVSRFLADLAPAYTVAGLVVGAALGLAVGAWVVGMRATLRDRAVLEGWVSDVVAEVRAVTEQMVLTRVLRAETALTAQLAALNEADAAELAGRVEAIDAELRQHATAAAEAGAVRDRRLPGLRHALRAVNVELHGDTAAPDG